MLPVVFPFAFNKLPSSLYSSLAYRFVNRVKEIRGMVYQLTDTRTPKIEGVDDCLRSENTELGLWYFTAMMSCPFDEFLRLDVDIHLPLVVPEVNGNYDIAVSKETKGILNNGVVFVRNRGFFEDCLSVYEQSSRDGWNDIQVATQKVIDSGEFKVKKLDPDVYNWIPSFMGQRNPNALIVHYEGPERKTWIGESK